MFLRYYLAKVIGDIIQPVHDKSKLSILHPDCVQQTVVFAKPVTYVRAMLDTAAHLKVLSDITVDPTTAAREILDTAAHFKVLSDMTADPTTAARAMLDTANKLLKVTRKQLSFSFW